MSFMKILKKYMLFLAFFLIYSLPLFSSTPHLSSDALPKEIRNYISKITFDKLGAEQSEVQFEVLSEEMVKVSLSWQLSDSLWQDDWQVNLYPSFDPDFHWSPHLTPTDAHIIAQHVFRAPALIASAPQKQLTIVPDLDILSKNAPVDWYMDLDAEENKLTLGLSKSDVKEHVLYTRKSGAVYPPGKLEFGFYILTARDEASIFNPWRKPLAFLWEKWGQPLYQKEGYIEQDLEPYVKHTYNWAFNSWRNNVWQEFELDGKQVGAPAFIVNVSQSPNFPGEVNEREFRSIWNQAWFSSLRSAQGLYRYARRTNKQELLGFALKTKELALSFPQKNGFFPGLIATEMEQIERNGKELNRSKGWGAYYFGNSNRNPYTWNAKEAPLHILDMSFTAYLMLTWYDELEKDERLLQYAKAYADALVKIQDKEGFFPAWLSAASLKPLAHLKQSPETSMSITFLLKLYELTQEEKYLHPAEKAMQAVIEHIIPVGRWEDFETYWSCSRYGADELLNEKVKRNNMFKQITFPCFGQQRRF
jgi:hypothetical protein